jgi:hypothetical protein
MFHHLPLKHPLAAGIILIFSVAHGGAEGGKLLTQAYDVLTHNPRAEHTLVKDIAACAHGDPLGTQDDPYSITRNVLRLFCH